MSIYQRWNKVLLEFDPNRPLVPIVDYLQISGSGGRTTQGIGEALGGVARCQGSGPL